jgi:uncharacterized protein YndB with AHSA1/START domain
MEQKTKIHAEPDKQDLVITRSFDLPLASLFKAHTEPSIVEQWMSTKVVKLECKNHGSWQFETSDAAGNVVFRSNGVIHEFEPNKKSPEHSKWKTHRSRYNSNFWNSNH